MLNTINLIGRLTKQPELRMTNTQKTVAAFTLAVDRDYDRSETDFVPCVAWGQTADFVDRNFTKGQMMALKGRLQSRDWMDKDGKARTSWEVVAESVYFCGDKKADAKPKSVFTDMGEDDGEIPF